MFKQALSRAYPLQRDWFKVNLSLAEAVNDQCDYGAKTRFVDWRITSVGLKMTS